MTNINDIMTKQVITVAEEETILEAAARMDEGGVGALIVLDKDSPVGIVTERDLVRRVILRTKDPKIVKVSEIMSKPLVVIEPERDIEGAAKTMVINDIRRLAVLEDGKLVGIVTGADFARSLAGTLTGQDLIGYAIARYHKYGY